MDTLLRPAAAFAAAAGALGSFVLMLRAGGRAPLFLIAAFVAWVVAPFAVLGWAVVAPGRWTPRARAAACWTAIVLAVVSLPAYARLVPMPRGTAPAFVFVMWPVVSWLAIAAVALVTRARGR
jgi:hypothetical protein